MTSPDPDEMIFSLGDLSWLIRKKKQTILRAALIFSIIALVYAFWKPSFYKAEATFKESAEQREPTGLLKDFFANMAVSSGAPQADALMKSSQVLKPLIFHLGLQAQVVEKGVFLRRWNRLSDTICSELGLPLSDLDSFRFSDVTFEGEKPLNLRLRFFDRERFEIEQNQDKFQGRVGEKMELKSFFFTIARAPKNVKTGFEYKLSISPWSDIAKRLRKNLQIISLKTNRAIYELSILERDRFLGAEILNELMKEYQRYLKRDHDQIAQMQLAYLEERQDLLFDKLGRAYDEHVCFLQRNVGDKGFIHAAQESAALSKQYRGLFSQSFSADLEMDQLSPSSENPSHVLVGTQTPAGQTIHSLRHTVLALEGQRDLLASSLYFHPSGSGRSVSEESLFLRDELQNVRLDLQTARSALDEIESKNRIPLHLELLNDPDHVVQSWAGEINKQGDEPKDFVVYLRNLVRLFSVREKILMERQFHPQNESCELNGIDLSTAQQLLIQSSQNLDGSKASIQHYCHLLSRIDDPSFEVSSLSAVLKDPVSQRYLSQATDLHFQMEDESHHSEKEVNRSKSESALQRKVLKEHLKQMIVVEQLNSSIYQDKIASLQQISLDCINRQISVNNEQIASLVRQRKESLIREKQILANKMQDLRSKMNELPTKWRAESLLKLKTELGIKIMQSVVQMVESKTIGQNLHHVESKPLDLAVVPFFPQKPYLFLIFLAGGGLGLIGGFLWVFLKTLYRGFPLSSDTLQALRYPYAGSISFYADGPNIDHLPDNDLESLRKLMIKIDAAPHSKLVGLFAGQGPDYAHSLAHLIAQSGRKVLLLRCDFSTKFSDADIPGLQQVINGLDSSIPIRRFNDYDLLPSGGYSRFGVELIRSAVFDELLKRLMPLYDHILLFNRSPLHSAECAALLAINQTAAVTIFEESIELLTPFIQWAYDDQRCRLTFLTTSC
jgi:hypothetical protein